MNLYFLKHNNYYNRRYKPINSLTGATVLGYIYNVANFDPADGVDTVQETAYETFTDIPDYMLAVEGEEIVRKRHDFFLHKCGVLSWESKYGNPTPFIAEVEEEETILKTPYDFRGRYDICNVDVGGKCGLIKTNDYHDCIIVNTRFFLQDLKLKDV